MKNVYLITSSSKKWIISMFSFNFVLHHPLIKLCDNVYQLRHKIHALAIYTRSTLCIPAADKINYTQILKLNPQRYQFFKYVYICDQQRFQINVQCCVALHIDNMILQCLAQLVADIGAWRDCLLFFIHDHNYNGYCHSQEYKLVCFRLI